MSKFDIKISFFCRSFLIYGSLFCYFQNDSRKAKELITSFSRKHDFSEIQRNYLNEDDVKWTYIDWCYALELSVRLNEAGAVACKDLVDACAR